MVIELNKAQELLKISRENQDAIMEKCEKVRDEIYRDAELVAQQGYKTYKANVKDVEFKHILIKMFKEDGFEITKNTDSDLCVIINWRDAFIPEE